MMIMGIAALGASMMASAEVAGVLAALIQSSGKGFGDLPGY